MKCRLEFIRDVFYENCYGARNYVGRKGDVIDYETWPYEYRGEIAKAREARGLFVFCRGHGHFETLRKDDEVKIILPKPEGNYYVTTPKIKFYSYLLATGVGIILAGLFILVCSVLTDAHADENATLHEVCYSDIGCFNAGAKCVRRNPDSLLNSGVCTGGVPPLNVSGLEIPQ